MKKYKDLLQHLFILFFPEIIFLIYLLMVFFYCKIRAENSWNYFVPGFAIFFIVKVIIFIFYRKYYYTERIKIIHEIVKNFKKGKFSLNVENVKGNDIFTESMNDLILVGKHLDSTANAQRNEIEKFKEMYNSIIMSISSYFLVLDESNKVLFANEGFCKKFRLDQEDIKGKGINNIFYFVNARLKGGIEKARKNNDSVVLEKTHLLSINKISIIADIKITNVVLQGVNQVIVILDDVTSKLRKDYQISLMSQISESIQKDKAIDRVLHTILTAVTSGSGLGFNRAMLFLVTGDKYLTGKMAVGPDSFEEAIEIWNSSSEKQDNLDLNLIEGYTGNVLFKNLTSNEYLLSEDNVFTRSVNNKEIIHIFDSWNDDNLDDSIKKFMDVKEFIIVPVIAASKPIGIIVVDNKFNQVPISRDSIELLTIFASQAALSIEGYNNLIIVKNEIEKLEERQDAIVESEKMAAVGRIAAHIAHEIRNPLVTMGGYSRRIMQVAKDPGKDSSKNREGIVKAAKIILKESERLEKILSNVMDFTKPSQYIKEFNNINEIIEDTCELLKNIFLENRIELKLNLKKDLPLVKSDFNQMKQVILNLFQNAIDATESGGEIVVETDNDEENVIIAVKDLGSGIKEDEPNIIFEPFFTTKVTGVGLGLANVKKIIKDHGGSISVRNREEQGVEFLIQIPLPS